jgi:hypothetical protein
MARQMQIGRQLRDCVPLIRLDASQSLIGCQLQLFKLTLVEIPDLGLQCRLWNGPHLECQGNGVLGRFAEGGGANRRGSSQLRAVKVRGEWNYQDRFKRLRQRITLPNHDGPSPRLFPGRYEPRSAHQTSPRFNFAPSPLVNWPSQRDLAQREEGHPRSRSSLISPNPSDWGPAAA